MIDGVAEFYRTDYANVHRGVYQPQRALDRAVRGGARDKCARFLNAADAREIVFVRGATEAINLVAQSWGAGLSQSRRRGARSASSSITPTSCRGRLLRDRIGVRLVVAPIDATGGLDLARVRGAAVAAHQAGRGDPCRQRHRRDAAGRAHRAAGARQGRQGAGRRLPGGAAPAGRCAGARLRFLCLLRPQGLRADRHRRALRPL